MKRRSLLRGRDVRGVASAFKAIQPGFHDVGSFLSTFRVLGKAIKKLSMLWQLFTNYVLDNGSNRLPEQTFDYALKLLRDSVTGKKHFVLVSDGEMLVPL
ncbi:hypothetical protein GN958_ATG03578 [Phytophthora infestans]|uniref:Uncharacterized protein n=1 Tax=Phytophthora infestans TaxID=4787 RepID=A0A8S9V9G7_PHYIN|nr:hypothetical protein GN958_ATG03578 [Phytophthora infestans]